MEPGLGLDKFPLLCGCDKGVRVELTVPVFVTKWPARGHFFPIRIFGVNHLGRLNAKVLDIAPSKVRSCGTVLDRQADAKMVKWTDRTWRARAKTPAAFGAAAEVPPWLDEQVFSPTSVVTWERGERGWREAKAVRTMFFPLPELYATTKLAAQGSE